MMGKKVVVVLLILGILGGIVGSAAWAAPKKSGESKADLALLDPFTLRTVSVTSARISNALLTRDAIRVPLKPQTRSAFRPNWR